MSDYHTLSLCIHENNINGAMLVLRDKSEFAASKILERFKVKLPVNTGRQFWHWIQNWLINESDSSPTFGMEDSILSGESESGSRRCLRKR